MPRLLRIIPTLAFLLAITGTPMLAGSASVRAQDSSPAASPISCEPQAKPAAEPAGTVRVYQRDARGNPQFVGEHPIGHTPMGSDIGLTTGQAFDVKVRPVVEERTRVNSSRWKTRMRYTLTNAGPKPVTVDLVQAGLWGDTRIDAESMKSERLSADETRWRVPVPANGEATVTATFDSRY